MCIMHQVYYLKIHQCSIVTICIWGSSRFTDNTDNKLVVVGGNGMRKWRVGCWPDVAVDDNLVTVDSNMVASSFLLLSLSLQPHLHYISLSLHHPQPATIRLQLLPHHGHWYTALGSPLKHPPHNPELLF